MKRKNVVSLIAIVAIVAVAVFFAGCVEPTPPPTTPPPPPPTETPPPTPPTETPTGEPDLSILSIDVTTSPMGEHLIEVTAEVYNGGTATADNFDVILNWNYVTDDPWLESSGSNVIVGSAYLVPGKSMKYTHPQAFVAGNPGLYAIEVIADPDDRIRESNENNNRYGPITKILG